MFWSIDILLFTILSINRNLILLYHKTAPLQTVHSDRISRKFFVKSDSFSKFSPSSQIFSKKCRKALDKLFLFWYNKQVDDCECAGIGRQARLRGVCFDVRVQVPSLAPTSTQLEWKDGWAGLRRTTGTRVYVDSVSRVRIPLFPPKAPEANVSGVSFLLYSEWQRVGKFVIWVWCVWKNGWNNKI